MKLEDLFGKTTINGVALRNCTPHDVHILINDVDTITIPRSGVIVRCEEIAEEEGFVVVDVNEQGTGNTSQFRIPLQRRRYGDVFGLPDVEEGVLNIVSYPVAVASAEREDLIVPHDMKRDKDGRIIGCRKFSRHFKEDIK